MPILVFFDNAQTKTNNYKKIIENELLKTAARALMGY
jgi:hypothetical protein